MISFVHYHRVSPKLFADHLEFYRRHYEVTTLEDLANNRGLGDSPLFITFDDGWDNGLLPLYREIPGLVTIFLSVNFIRHEKEGMLTLRHIEEMKDYVNFQSHGITHTDLTTLPIEEARREIRESKTIIEGLTGNPVYAYAYPFNKCTPQIAREVEEARYKLGRVGDRMLNDLDTDRFMLRSIGVPAFCSVGELRYRILKARVKTLLSGLHAS